MVIESPTGSGHVETAHGTRRQLHASAREGSRQLTSQSSRAGGSSLPMMVLHLDSRDGAAGGFVQTPIDDKRAGVAASGHLAAPVRVEMCSAGATGL